jgi:hypothetical protein
LGSAAYPRRIAQLGFEVAQVDSGQGLRQLLAS